MFLLGELRKSVLTELHVTQWQYFRPYMEWTESYPFVLDKLNPDNCDIKAAKIVQNRCTKTTHHFYEWFKTMQRPQERKHSIILYETFKSAALFSS